mgnify:CR=1 FL=1
MGLLIDGQWHDRWYDTDKSGGRFVREDARFRHWVTADGAPGPSKDAAASAATALAAQRMDGDWAAWKEAQDAQDMFAAKMGKRGLCLLATTRNTLPSQCRWSVWASHLSRYQHQ